MLNTKTLRSLTLALMAVTTVLTALLTNFMLSGTKINGPLYARIVASKDLIADVLPPPDYIIESYFVATKLMVGDSTGSDVPKSLINNAAKRLLELKTQYEDRRSVWAASTNINDEAKNMVVNESHQYVTDFYNVLEQAFLPALLAGNSSAASEAYASMSKSFEAHREVVDRIVANQTLAAAENEAAATAINITALWWVAAGAAGMLLLSGSAVWFLSRRALGPLDLITETLVSGAQESSIAAGQVAQASHQLAEGAGEASAAIEETSASLEQMTSMLHGTANNTVRAKGLMNEAHSAAQHSSERMGEMTAAMQSISQSSAEVAKIVKSIDEIAFQTNILALNAAIEAARAGEAGAGFAVVADEVRSLAQRSSAAAQETAEKIEAAIMNSRNGSQSLVKLGESFGLIEEKVHQTEGLVSEIAAAAKEQSLGVEQVATAISELGRVSARNASNAETTASAAEELSAQAKEQLGLADNLRAVTGAASPAKRKARIGGAAQAEWQSPRQLKDRQSARETPALTAGNADQHFIDQ